MTYAKLVRLKKVYRTKDSLASQNPYTANLVRRGTIPKLMLITG